MSPEGGSKEEKPPRAPAPAPAPTVHPISLRSRMSPPPERIVSSQRDLRKVRLTFPPKPPNTEMDCVLRPGRVEPPPRRLWGVDNLSGPLLVASRGRSLRDLAFLRPHRFRDAKIRTGQPARLRPHPAIYSGGHQFGGPRLLRVRARGRMGPR